MKFGSLQIWISNGEAASKSDIIDIIFKIHNLGSYTFGSETEKGIVVSKKSHSIVGDPSLKG